RTAPPAGPAAQLLEIAPREPAPVRLGLLPVVQLARLDLGGFGPGGGWQLGALTAGLGLLGLAEHVLDTAQALAGAGFDGLDDAVDLAVDRTEEGERELALGGQG